MIVLRLYDKIGLPQKSHGLLRKCTIMYMINIKENAVAPEINLYGLLWYSILDCTSLFWARL